MLVVLQCEHIQAVEDADAIFSVPGIDAIFVGPNDLAASMRGKDGKPPSGEATAEAMKHILATCRKHGVAPGLHCMNAEEARHRIEEGWQFVAVVSELKMMLDGVADVVQKLGLQRKGGDDGEVLILSVKEARCPLLRRPTGKCRPASTAACGTTSTTPPSLATTTPAWPACRCRTWTLRFVEEHCPRPGWLLDLGCGTGRLLIPFARRGYPVLGVDLSEEMLAVARDKADAAGVRVHLLHANLAELDGLRDGGFDYAACLFSTLGMVMGAANRRRVVGHAFRLLRPGGRFVLHVHNRWFNVWNGPGRAWLLRDVWDRRSAAARAATASCRSIRAWPG